MSTPKDYVEMEYNRGTHRYIPTQLGIEKKIATRLESLTDLFDGTGDSLTAEIQAWLDEISSSVYDWVYSEAPIDNHRYIEWMFAYDTRCQKLLWEAFVEQAKYDIRSGGLLVGSQTGINIERAKHIDRKHLRGRIAIADGVEKKLRQTGLLANMSLPYTIADQVYRVNY